MIVLSEFITYNEMSYKNIDNKKMKNAVGKFLALTFMFWLAVFTAFSGVSEFNKAEKAVAATTGNVTLGGTVLQYIALTLSAGSTIAFGNITPGTPVCSSTGTVASVSTNAANGYTLGLSDGSDTVSSMTHTDAVTTIPDMAGTFAVPASWSNGTTTGVGVTMFAADTTKEAAWGTGTTTCDANNKWAGVPASSTVGHTVTGYQSSADTSSWGWKIDTLNSQQTGTYSGQVLFTSVASLT